MDQELFQAARTVRDNAHARYSHFNVGAALRTESGAVHAGCNVENAAFPLGWCAEASAIAHMISASADPKARRIAMVCVVADPIEGRITTPCGGCRQRIAEFAGPDTPVHCQKPDGTGRTYTLAELLPGAFSLGGGS